MKTAHYSSTAEIAVTRTGMTVGGKPIYLRSGELVYFRPPPGGVAG